MKLARASFFLAVALKRTRAQFFPGFSAGPRVGVWCGDVVEESTKMDQDLDCNCDDDVPAVVNDGDGITYTWKGIRSPAVIPLHQPTKPESEYKSSD